MGIVKNAGRQWGAKTFCASAYFIPQHNTVASDMTHSTNSAFSSDIIRVCFVTYLPAQRIDRKATYRDKSHYIHPFLFRFRHRWRNVLYECARRQPLHGLVDGTSECLLLDPWCLNIAIIFKKRACHGIKKYNQPTINYISNWNWYEYLTKAPGMLRTFVWVEGRNKPFFLRA